MLLENPLQPNQMKKKKRKNLKFPSHKTIKKFPKKPTLAYQISTG
jgi:hypothetical protein